MDGSHSNLMQRHLMRLELMDYNKAEMTNHKTLYKNTKIFIYENILCNHLDYFASFDVGKLTL
jgi:hypothetical protein